MPDGPAAAAPESLAATAALTPSPTAPPTPAPTPPPAPSSTAAAPTPSPTTVAPTPTPAPTPPPPPAPTAPTAPTVAARVAGTAAILPRGFLWQFPLWYAAFAAYLAFATWPPLWFRASAAAGLLGALITLLGVLGSLTLRAFSADDSGITLGLPATTRRRGRRRRATRHLAWEHIERVRLRPGRGGTRIEIFLTDDAPATAGAVHYPAADRAWRAILLLIPFWYLRRPTGLLTPLDDPPRYRAALRGTSFDELRLRLRALAPGRVTIAVLVPRSLARSVSSAPSPERAALSGKRAVARWHTR